MPNPTVNTIQGKTAIIQSTSGAKLNGLSGVGNTNGSDTLTEFSINGVVNVKTYGAKGNGSNDDSAAINQAIASATASPGQVLYLPAATYAIYSTPVVVPSAMASIALTIAGDGMGLTTIYMTTNANLATLLSATNAPSNLTIRDLTLDCNRDNNTLTNATGVQVTGGNDVVLERVEIKNCATCGVQFSEPGTRNMVRFSRFSGNGTNGGGRAIKVTTSQSSTVATDIRIEGNYVDDSGKNAGCIKSVSSGGSTLDTLRVLNNTCVMGSTGSANSWGIELFSAGAAGGGEAVVRHVLVEGNSIFGTNTNNQGISLAGSTVDWDWKAIGNSIANVSTGVGLEDAAPDTIVMGNNISYAKNNSINAGLVTIPLWATCTAGHTGCATYSDHSSCATGSTGEYIVGDGHARILIPGSGNGGTDESYYITQVIASPTATATPGIEFDHAITTSVTCQPIYPDQWGVKWANNRFDHIGSSTAPSGGVAVGSGTVPGVVEGATIEGNSFLYPQGERNVINLSSSGPLENLVIEGNLCVAAANTGGSYCVQAAGAKYTRILNNTAYNWTGNYAFSDAASSTGTFFENNRCANPAAGTTCLHPLGSQDAVNPFEYQSAIERAAPSGTPGYDLIWGDSTAHRLKMNNNNGGATNVASWSDSLSNFAALTGALGSAVATPAYGATVTPDLSAGFIQKIVVTNGSAWTLANALNAVAGQVWQIDLFNNSGGAMGAITLGASYKADASWGAPANGKRRVCTVTNESASVFLINSCSGDE